MEKETKTVFNAEQLTIGVGAVTPEGVHLFLKVDPRLIMDALDEKFGPTGWKKESNILNFNGQKTCKCIISVKDGESNWIDRSDYSATADWAGSNQFKVMDSDAFRRCAMNFGIGRELYSFDNIYVPLADSKGNPNVNVVTVDDVDFNTGVVSQKTICTDSFYIEQMKYDENGKIVALAIKTTEGKTVFVENREDKRLQGTIVDGENNIPGLSDARQMKAGIGSLTEKKLGELSKDELLYVWSNTRDAKIKKACLVVAKGNPETKHLFMSKGITL